LLALSVPAALFCAGPALGGARTLSGTVDPAGTVKIKISFERLRDGQTVRVYDFALHDIPMSCSHGTATEFDLRGRAPTLNRPGERDLFGLGHSSLDSEGNREEWTVIGLLQKPGLAVGTARVRTIDTGGRRSVDCRSGRLPWTAVK
jgi:hypothetical protein